MHHTLRSRLKSGRRAGRAAAAAGAATALLASLAAGGAPASAADSAPTFVCTFGNWDMAYAPTASLAQDGTAVTLTLGDFPAIAGVPEAVTVSHVKSAVAATVSGRSITLAGEHGVSPATPMADGFRVPPLRGTLPAGMPAGTLGVTSLAFTVTAMGMENPIACEATSSGAFAVAATPVPKVGSKTTAKVTVAKKKVKKKRAVTATVQVKGGAGVATGKVQMTLSKGKKALQKKTVALTAKGTATAKLKKLAKGKYSLTVKYAGDRAYTASSTKVTFRVK